jgi:hypothetical protein
VADAKQVLSPDHSRLNDGTQPGPLVVCSSEIEYEIGDEDAVDENVEGLQTLWCNVDKAAVGARSQGSGEIRPVAHGDLYRHDI